MITLNSNEEALALIKDGVLAVDDDIEIAFDGFDIAANIACYDICCKDHWRDISAKHIRAKHIRVRSINAININATSIDAIIIYARNITALYLCAVKINAYAIEVGQKEATYD